MNDKNKKFALIGLFGIGAGYLILKQPSHDSGGFGGGGGLPLIPAGSPAEPAGSPAGTTYNFPSIPDVEWGGLGDSAGFDDGTKKGIAATTTTKLDLSKYDPRTPSFTLGITPEIPSVYSVKGADMYSKGLLSRSKKVEVKKPVRWGESSPKGFFDFLYPLTQIGKGVRGRNLMSTRKDKSIQDKVMSHKRVTSKSYVTQQQYTKKSTNSSSSGYYHDTTSSGDKVTVIGGRVRPGHQ